ncbi:MAG TPA: hypothetical protein VMF07_03510 [Solirubrobacteraceae bacterium]|nr:hypothetical protein [Solirubrobacteraceae bacterium]
MLRRTVIALALTAGLAAPAAAGAKTYTARDGSVHAVVTTTGTLARPVPPTLTITNQGASGTARLFHGPVSNHACGTGCVVSLAPADPPVRFAALDGAGSKDVIVNLYSGGANCCSVLDLFRPSAALGGQYVLSASHNFAYAGYRLERLHGRRVFVTADPSFSTVFTDFADSGLPLQILRLSGVKFVDVTSSYPGLVRLDATRWMTAYRKAHGHNDVGLIAPWAADEARLGRWSSAHAYLVAQARAGRLRSALLPHAASGTRFITQLEALLRRDGYLKR